MQKYKVEHRARRKVKGQRRIRHMHTLLSPPRAGRGDMSLLFGGGAEHSVRFTRSILDGFLVEFYCYWYIIRDSTRL